MAGKLRVKEVHVASLIAGSDQWSARRHDELVGSLKTKSGLGTAEGHVAQSSVTTAAQKSILTALGLVEPPKFFDVAASA